MSTFDQKKQSVSTQINIAGNLGVDERDAVIWVSSNESGRYFSNLWDHHVKLQTSDLGPVLWLFKLPLKKLIEIRADYDKLNSENDFKIAIQDDNQNLIVQETFNLGDTLKINLRKGKYKIQVTAILDAYRQKFVEGSFSSNTLAVPVNSAETVKIELSTSPIKLKFSV